MERRDIKFRVWSLEAKEMFMDYPLVIEENGKITLNKIFSEQDYIFMQYTGVKDKNGKEIYEGDILQNEKTKEISYIEYDDYHACYRSIAIHKDYKIASAIVNLIFHGDLKLMKKVGNIYENTELL